MATAELGSLDKNNFPALKVLSHAQVELRKGRVHVHCASSCDLIARANSDGVFTLENPLRKGWLPTEDLARWQSDGLRILGRRDDIVKILGTLVSVDRVEHEARRFFAQFAGDLTLLAVRGAREGSQLVLVTDSPANLREWETAIQSYNAKSIGPHRIHKLVWLPRIPRSALGKVARKGLARDLGWG